MYSPGRLAIATAAQATRASSTKGAGPITGNGIGETIHTLKND
jgi:hypothetical protein